MAGREPKSELLYFSKYVTYYDDYKLEELMINKGPLGQVIYDIIVCEIFKKGFYLEIPIEQLANKIVKIIGNRWVRDKQTVMQVIHYCADIGLFEKDLLQQNVITSVELQETYAEVTVRRQFQGGKYWLLEKKKDKQSLLKTPKNPINVTGEPIDVTEIDISVSRNATKESKVKESKRKKTYKEPYVCFENPDIQQAFGLYLSCRKANGQDLRKEQVEVLKQELITLSDKDDERLAMLRKAIAGNWKSFYPIGKQGSKNETNKSSSNKFNNFDSRKPEFQSLEQQLLKRKND